MSGITTDCGNILFNSIDLLMGCASGYRLQEPGRLRDGPLERHTDACILRDESSRVRGCPGKRRMSRRCDSVCVSRWPRLCLHRVLQLSGVPLLLWRQASGQSFMEV